MATMQITLIMDGDNFDSGGNMHSNYNATNVKMTADNTTTTIYEWVQLMVESAETHNLAEHNRHNACQCVICMCGCVNVCVSEVTHTDVLIAALPL